eukprot:561105-Alexandrium_andersonii.AAC.1
MLCQVLVTLYVWQVRVTDCNRRNGRGVVARRAIEKAYRSNRTVASVGQPPTGSARHCKEREDA